MKQRKSVARVLRLERLEVHGSWEDRSLNLDTNRLSYLAATLGLTTLLACAPAAAPAAPTPKPAAPAASPAASPIASPAASPAVASPVATSAAALASPAATTAAAASPAAATAAAASPVRITAAQITPTDTTITVQNAGTAAVGMAGWKLRVGTATATLPGNASVAPNDTVTIHTASGTSAGKDIYLGQEASALLSGLQPGATVALVDAQGATVNEFVLPR